MTNEDVRIIRGGALRGHLLRAANGRAEIRGPDAGAEWTRAPLRQLARDFAVGEGPWPWLLSRGVRRPSTTSGDLPEADRDRRQVMVRMTDAERRALDELAQAWGVSRGEAIARLVREHAG